MTAQAPNRRWLRFSLRTLFVVVTPAAIAAAGLNPTFIAQPEWLQIIAFCVASTCAFAVLSRMTDSVPGRRWHQFSLGGLMLWVVPYVTVITLILSQQDATPPSNDPFVDAFGEALFHGLKVFAALAFTGIWLTAFVAVKIVGAIIRWRGNQRAALPAAET